MTARNRDFIQMKIGIITRERIFQEYALGYLGRYL